MDSSLLAAFLVGLAGGVHCVGMCGGIVAAVALRRCGARAMATGMGALAVHEPALASQSLFHLAFNAGRVASYAAAGAGVGAIGSLGLLLDTAAPVQLALRVAASGLIVLLGLHVAGVGSMVISSLEGAGARLWRGVRLIGRGVFPPDTPTKALAAGAVWGWLPCGLVYGMLATALVGGSAERGAVIMLAFGLGTLPNLIAAGLLADRLRQAIERPGLRRTAGVAIAALGIIALVQTPGLGARLREGLLCLT
ncbi:MAG: sulfite exporter TauE/SafE family protein [Burkholderiales bacterium]|nr:sulfite exporter TauE/SafE family protein [Burkholderiales bacterium]